MDEIEKLRAELDEFRRRELSDLKSALAAAMLDRDHYRSEAYRNAEIGRQIAREHQAENDKLKAQIAALTAADSAMRRGISSRAS